MAREVLSNESARTEYTNNIDRRPRRLHISERRLPLRQFTFRATLQFLPPLLKAQSEMTGPSCFLQSTISEPLSS
jgi:hypothetical protein